MKGLVSIAVSVSAGLMLGGCVAAVVGQATASGASSDARGRPPADADTRIAGAVRGRLGADAALRGAPITVSVYSGTVTLRGTVATEALRVAAELNARAAVGVVAVNNQLEVN